MTRGLHASPPGNWIRCSDYYRTTQPVIKRVNGCFWFTEGIEVFILGYTLLLKDETN
jgi:hypothetical protein